MQQWVPSNDGPYGLMSLIKSIKNSDNPVEYPKFRRNISAISPYLSMPRENAPVFFKIVKNRSISFDFCKKRATFRKKRTKICKNRSKKGPLWRRVTFAPTF